MTTKTFTVGEKIIAPARLAANYRNRAGTVTSVRTAADPKTGEKYQMVYVTFDGADWDTSFSADELID